MSLPRVRTDAVVLLCLALPGLAAAQFPILKLPMESPGASVGQTIGLSQVSVQYHRPAVKGRKVWGALVPYDSVWRAGANQNTVLEVTAPFQLGSTRLPAGRYGMHLLPTATSWTIILSKQANAWGSFSYSPTEDVARLSITPTPADFTEWLEYSLDNPTDSTVQVTLHWEKLAGSFPLTLASAQAAVDSISQQLRDIPWFFAESWAAAADWGLNHNVRLDLVEAWADSAIRRNPNFRGYRLKSMALERRGDAAGAEAQLQRALSVATEPDVNVLGYQQLGQGKLDQAIVTFTKNTKDYPKSWNVWDSLAEALAQKGDKRLALANYQKALNLVQDERQKQRIRAAMTALQ